MNTGVSVSAIRRGLAHKAIRQPGRSSKHHHLARITLFRRAEAARLHSPHLEDDPLTSIWGNQFSAIFLLAYGKTRLRANISHTSLPETSGFTACGCISAIPTYNTRPVFFGKPFHFTEKDCERGFTRKHLLYLFLQKNFGLLKARFLNTLFRKKKDNSFSL